MKASAQINMLIAVVCVVARLHGATYVWSGGGGESNWWSNPENWTNIVDGSAGVPGAGDDAVFPKAEQAPPSTVVALDSDVTVNNLTLGNYFQGLLITGAYTITVTTNAPVLWGATYYGGAATVDAHLAFPNVGADITWVNYNQQFTVNGDINLPIGNTTRQLTVNGENAKAVINGQLRGYTNATSQRLNIFCNPADGVMEIGTQHYPHRQVFCRMGTLILKGNWDAPNGELEHSVGFPNWDGNTPRRIWVQAESGTAIFSNRFSFLPRANDTKYQEFRVTAPTINAISIGQVRFDDRIWVFVEEGSYWKLAGGINKGDNATTHGVYLDGGGTTDIARAALTTFEIPFIVSNGVLLVNNGSDGLATHGLVTVCAQGVLGGNGGVGAVIAESGARLTPGNSIGTLFVSNNCSLSAGTVIDWEVWGGSSDVLQVGGTLDISAGTVTVQVRGYCEPSDTNVLMTAGTLLGGVGNIAVNLDTNYFIAGGEVLQEGSQILITGLVPVPEPVLIGVVGFAALCWVRRLS